MTIDPLARLREHLDRGQPWEACDAFRSIDATGRRDAEALYWGALAHARAGASREAQALLDLAQVAAHGAGQRALLVEILSLRGRLLKDALHRAVRREGTTTAAAEHARSAYLDAWRLGRDPYPGVNAATLSMLLGDTEAARSLAADVVAAASRVPDTGGSPGWVDATLGEAKLLQGDLDGAKQSYAAAKRAAAGNAGMIASMRRQLALLAQVLPTANEVLAELPAPSVLAFTGHMIDAPGRANPRFPASLVPQVAQALRDRLASLHQPIVFVSAACGADLLCVEAAFEAGAEVDLVLPFDRDEFVRSSVAPGGGEWVARFEAALARAHRVVVASGEQYLGDDILFEHGARIVDGLATLRAGQLQTEPVLLCVFDPGEREDDAARVGGTRSTVARWCRQGGAVDVIDLRKLRGDAPADSISTAGDARREMGGSIPVAGPAMAATAAATDSPPARRRTLKSMLFADFAGYSKLRDAVIPDFQRVFLDAAAALIDTAGAKPLEAKTWGDALYTVFDDASDAAEFALRFAERMRSFDWARTGVGDAVQVRVALHAGPVYRTFDPVMRRDSYFGANVTRAARIEPITPVGVVYASETFAATLAPHADGRFAIEYVGATALAKGFGEARVYRLERA